MKDKFTKEAWVTEILDVEQTITDTLHGMISHRILKGPWNDVTDVNDGWRVIEDIVARAKEKLTVRETEGVALPLVKKAFEKV